MNWRKIGSSFNAPLHIILRRFKFIPILVLIFFAYLTWDIHMWYKLNALILEEWQVAGIFAYLGTLIPIVMKCLDAIRKGEETDAHDNDQGGE